MNERINKLMIEAGYAAPELAGRAHKFAELLIQECAKFIDENTIVDRYGEIEKLVYGKDLTDYFYMPHIVSTTDYKLGIIDIIAMDPLADNELQFKRRDGSTMTIESYIDDKIQEALKRAGIKHV